MIKIPNYPCLLIDHGKHENEYYLIKENKDLGRCSLVILEGRLRQNFFDDEEQKRVKELLDEYNCDSAWEMVQERQDYEYEEITLQKFR